MNISLVWQSETYEMTLYKRKNLLSRLLSQYTYCDISFHISIQLESNTPP